MSSIAKPILFGNDFQSAWARLTKDIPLSRIHTRKQYDLVVRAMEYLADLVNDDPGHSLAGLLEIFEVIVEDYDRIHHQIPSVSGVELLRSLMTEHGHKDQIGTTVNEANKLTLQKLVAKEWYPKFSLGNVA